MTKDNHAALCDQLDNEANRFTGLAKELALQVLLTPARADATHKTQLAKDHLIRAEAYRDAARRVAATK